MTMAGQSTFSIQVWIERDGKTLQWQARRMADGSHVKVAVSEQDHYWIWENVMKCDQMFWRFRSGLDHRLYVAFDDCNRVKLRSHGSKTYFKVYVAYNGYIIQEPDTQHYLAVKDGLIVLSHVPAVWSLTLQHAKETIPYARIMSLESDRTLMWICNRPVEGAWITVQKSTPDNDQALWYISSVAFPQDGFHIQPKLNDNLLVTNDVSTNSVTLECETDPEKSIIIRKEQGPPAIILLDASSTRYICVEQEGNTLELTASVEDAAGFEEWIPELYTFHWSINLITPPDLKPKPRNEIKASEPAPILPLNVE